MLLIRNLHNRVVLFTIIFLLTADWALAAPKDLIDAADAGDLAAVTTLLAGKADINATRAIRGGFAYTALSAASGNGHLEVVRALLAAGADVNAYGVLHTQSYTIPGPTALYMAAENDHLDVVQALLAAGAQTEAGGGPQGTALATASFQGYLDVVLALLAAKANVNFTSGNGVTALYLAAQDGHADVVQALLSAGANVDARITALGATPLMVASFQGHINVVRALLAKGADVNGKSNDGRTALDAATAGGHADIRALLVQAGQDRSTAKSAEFPQLQGASLGQIIVNPKDGLSYVWIEPGKFTMGCSQGDTDCKPKRTVLGGQYDKPPQVIEISRGFWIGQTVVTVGAWKKHGKSLPRASVRTMVDNRPLNLTPGWTNYPGWGDEQQPMVGLALYDAREFCESEGLRLPTEEEWEFAARAGSTAARYGELDDIAWNADNSGRERIDSATLWKTAPVRKHYDPPGDKYLEVLKKNANKPHDVGLKQPNAWKLYDMLGNVWQWTANYETADMPQSLVPPGADNKLTAGVERGGSWYDPPSAVRASSRLEVLIPGLEFEGNTNYSSRDTISGAVRCVGQ